MTDTINNVPRELLERAVRIPTKASVEENHAAIVDRGRAQSELRALLSAPSPAGVYSADPLACPGCASGCFRCASPAGVDGLGVAGYISQDDIKWQGDCTLRFKPYSDYVIPLCHLSDAQAIIDGLLGEVERLGSQKAEWVERATALGQKADQQAQRIGELEGLLLRVQVSLSLDDTEWGYSGAEKYKLLADIRAALSADKEGE